MHSHSDSSTPGGDTPTQPAPPMKRGDEVPTGTPGSGEDVCPQCGGSGLSNGQRCANCAGTGRVNVGIGGG